MDDRRFALYFAPEDGTELARFGWWWLGRHPETAELGPLPELGLPSSYHADLVADARHYGFHATLKAPFRLAESHDLAGLRAAIADFARRRRPFAEPPFALDELHGFLALRPSRPSTAIAGLAQDCVEAFDGFRAPPTEAERRKRLAAPLTARQRELLERWGYPYVLDEFRFHLTLTRQLPDDERAALRALVAPLVAPTQAEPGRFASLCLFEQAAADAPFVLSTRFPLRG